MKDLFFADMRWRKHKGSARWMVLGKPSCRRPLISCNSRHPGIAHRRLDALAALLDSGIRQANDDLAGHAGGVVHFHFDHHSVQADDCTGIDAREHG